MKMSMKTWIVGFVVAALAGANAGVVFSQLESRYTAALVAGGGFLVAGFFLHYLVWTDKRPFVWCTFYTSSIHIFAVSLPLLSLRILNPETPFEELTILGVPGPDFHRYSTFFYKVMIVGVLVDSVRFYRKKKVEEGVTSLRG